MSRADRFVFNPSLIWLPFGKGNPDGLTFPVEPTFAKRGIDFAQSAAVEIEAVHKQVQAADGHWYGCEYLVIAAR